jgi:hypothetical protein
MNNPAQYLLQLFEAAERDNGQTFTARDSSAAMAEIERQAAMLEAGDERPQAKGNLGECEKQSPAVRLLLRNKHHATSKGFA